MFENQILLFIIFLVNGLLIGIFFDIFRILRKTFNTKDIITYIEDILFWILTGLITIYFIFNFNNGEIRAYIFLGIISGVLIYMILISKYVIKINVIILTSIKHLILKISNIIIKPIKNSYTIIKNMIFKIFKKYINKIYKNITIKSSKLHKKIKKV